jgi:pilus assembly protein CpaE
MAENVTVVVIDADDASRGITKSLLTDISWVSIAGEGNDPSQALDLVRQIRPEVVVLNLSAPVDKLLRLSEKILQNLPNTTLFVTSSDKNPETIIRAMRSGAREFLPQPLDSEELKAAFRKLRLSRQRAVEGISHGKVISVFGMKGGVGATTIAINLAVNMAQRTERKVILVDLNLQLGNAALFLNIKPKYSIVDIAGSIEEIDPMSLKGVLARHSSGMYLLAGPSRPEQSEVVRESNLDRILTLLRSMFDVIVIDTTHVLGELTVRAMDESDVVLAVFTDDLPAIYNARQCLDIFERMGSGQEKIRLVMNRGFSNRGISPNDVEKTINYPVFWRIPNERYPTVLSSLNQGIPISIFKPRSKLSASFRDLAAHMDQELYPKEEGPGRDKKRGLVKRLFARK